MPRHHRRRSPPKPRRSVSVLDHINPNAAGIDCGASEHVVAVPPDRDPAPVKTFRTFTGDLTRLADWLGACGVTSIALEATGIYWIPVFEMLEARGFQVSLVNARHVKNVPGRKSDVSDAEWIRDLHMMGLLRASFRPTDAIVGLRAYMRHRASLVESTSALVQRMQKALMQMNVQLPLVVADITGETGMRILRDIVAGRTDPHALAQHRDYRCHASEAEIAAALTGNYRPEHVFVLHQHLRLYDVHQEQIAACDEAIQAHLDQMTRTVPLPVHPLPEPRTRTRPRSNEPTFDVRTPLHHLTGTDLSQIDGIGPHTALRLIAEIGTDMTRWPTEHHFTSWLTLAPRNKISGGRLLSSRTQPSENRAAAILRMAAMTLGRSSTALGAFYRRLSSRIGKVKAVTATARKLAILVYRTLKGDLHYDDPGAEAYDAQHRVQVLRRLRHRAKMLGLALVDLTTGEVLEAAVS
ncbi:MAG: IS110 family transposase [Chloroflexota bacterium]|nr:IS110 family transposase [Chloroflexota bacterium]